jgi:hypothetical protein
MRSCRCGYGAEAVVGAEILTAAGVRIPGGGRQRERHGGVRTAWRMLTASDSGAFRSRCNELAPPGRLLEHLAAATWHN